MLADCRLALPFERGVNYRELPPWRRLPRPDPVLTTLEMKIDRDIPSIVNPGKTGTNAKIHVRQIAVLSITGAYADSSRVAVFDLDIDIAHLCIKCSRIRVWRSRIWPSARTFY